MIQWMIQALIRLSPDNKELSSEVKKTLYSSENSVEMICQNGDKIITTIEKFTMFLIQ
jgi:hypothetical protein